MTTVEALKLALKKEMDAIELYKGFIKDHSAANEIFEFLLNEEYKHKQMVEKKIVELTRA
ncbi:MAG: hypothetical protein JW800_04095 [Candidatus Omnitrophica bacterium]|nr:hypothetical protein [Candidatus Omnitrophota bacterium]